MPNLEGILAPRALTTPEVASIIAPELVVYALSHRAFTHGRIWFEDETEGATRMAAESVQKAIVDSAESSMFDWLVDVDADNEPRFFRKNGLRTVIRELCSAAAQIACACNSEAELNLFVRQLEDRDQGTTDHLIGVAGGAKLS